MYVLVAPIVLEDELGSMVIVNAASEIISKNSKKHYYTRQYTHARM